ncbi:MAG: hypothetical protein LQ340_001739 [Diploschistes diacapsis]|nr:MAG: hypothetical protein LQ340_001739 [Diploschistes diacapsis]
MHRLIHKTLHSVHKPSPSLRTVPRRRSSTQPPNARLNLPIDYSTTPLLHHHPSTLSTSIPNLPSSCPTTRQNLFQSINSALSHALRADDSVLLFGEDVAFGGVFRCSSGLATEFGAERVFNTPLSEQGIVGFAVGAAAQGMRPVAEIQFADYVYPAFDQLVNEAAKYRYREGHSGRSVGGLVVRMPCGAVGHGGLMLPYSYHTQSPESLFTHIPGLVTVLPRSPSQAKGLLTTAILHSNDPVLFLEPKTLYRAAVEHVPEPAYTLPLCKAETLRAGKDVTVISYGAPLYKCSAAIEILEQEIKGVSCELIDLRTIYPWDREGVVASVSRTGRAVVVHESMVNAGVGAEVSAGIQEGCFLRLEAPVRRVAGWSTHTGLVFEGVNLPDVARIYDAIKQTLEY